MRAGDESQICAPAGEHAHLLPCKTNVSPLPRWRYRPRPSRARQRAPDTGARIGALSRPCCRGDVDQITAGCLHMRDSVSTSSALVRPAPNRSVDAHAHRRFRGHDGAHRSEHLDVNGRASPPSRRTRRALIGERREEGRQQIAVRAVQLDQVEARLDRRSAARTNSAFTPSHMARVISRGGAWRVSHRQRARPQRFPATFRSGTS